jgi:hypothetical protein
MRTGKDVPGRADDLAAEAPGPARAENAHDRRGESEVQLLKPVVEVGRLFRAQALDGRLA